MRQQLASTVADRSRLRQAGGYPQILLCFPYVLALDKVSALPPEYPGWMEEFQGRQRTVDGMTTR
jgi:hypothetical protein